MIGLFKPKKKTDRAKILLVDDKHDVVEIIQHRLNLYGWEVITSANGKEGLQKAANEKPDLIVLDINMPIMNGHDMLDSLRANPALRDIPVIMCTISNRIEDITKASSFNISDYVTKPFNCTELAEKIREALENKASN
jgi:CheY-like chemotaxis protein